MAIESVSRKPRFSERWALRALLYTVMGVSTVLILLRYIVWVPGAVVPQTNEYENLVLLIRYRLDLSTLLIVFVLSLAGLAASTEPRRPG